MSAPRFRVGDVVQTPLNEIVVTSVGDGVVRAGRTVWAADVVTLLRRPVQVGDVLVFPKRGWRIEVTELRPGLRGPGANPIGVMGRHLESTWYSNHVALITWLHEIATSATHEDGTPIEPPQPVAEDPSIARKARESAVHALSLTKGWEEKALQSIPLRADPWCPDDTYVIVSPRSCATGKLPAALPDVDTLARALFDTDPEVIAFVEQVADAHVRKHATRWNAVTMRADTVHDIAADAPERLAAAMQRAWDRDEHGWSTRATARAEAVLGRLGR